MAPFARSFATAATALFLVIGWSLSAVAQLASSPDAFAMRLSAAALERTKTHVIYDPAYRKLAYPGGDVPLDRGVCSDVVVRSYRALGIDLQKLVHEDMRRSFRAYPKRWGLRRPDKNIDHRRVPNLRTFFKRHGQMLQLSTVAGDYKPGDLVTWDIAKPYNQEELMISRASTRGKQRFAQTPHIGIVSSKLSSDGKRPLIIHNIGLGTRLDDMLFKFRVTGHYRFQPDTAQ